MKILYIQPVHEAGMRRLAEHHVVCVAPDTRRETLLACVRDADAIVTRLTRVDAKLMAAAPRLKAVCKHWVGVDNIDVEYARTRGIAVLTTGDANSATVAEHAMIAIGALMKRTVHMDAATRRGDWGARDCGTSVDLARKTLGLVGYGRIGSRLARMAWQGFDMHVAVFDPYVSAEDVRANGCEWVPALNELLARADVLSVHVPLTEETRGMLGREQFLCMRPGSYVVNFARGGIVDETALADLLACGHIAGAAIDVFAQEPPEGSPLLHAPNALLSPHCATFTEDSRRRMSLRLAEEIEKIFSSHGMIVQ